MSDSERMSPVDTAWWHMEDPTNLMMITGIMTFDGQFDYDRVRRVIQKRLLRFDRFRQRIVESSNPLVGPRWERDPHFDLDAHLRVVGLPAPGGKPALERLVSDLMSTPLDYSKPLWQFYLIENYNGGCALVGRLHHCIADGISLMRVLLEMTDDTPESPDLDEEPRKSKKPGLLRRMTNPAIAAAKTARSVTGTVLHESITTVQNPGRVWEATKFGAASAAQLGIIAARTPDPKTLFKGQLGTSKRAAWSRQLPLEDVKAIGRMTGGTVNDVMVTAVAGALRRYMEARGADTTGLNFRAYIPVNLRPLEGPLQLGNQFGLVFLSLPIGVVDQVERLNVVKQRMDNLKDSPEAFVAITLLNAGGMLPADVENLIFRFFHTKATAVLTNVPGPQKQLYMAGNPLREILGWVPQSGKLGLGISILSYNNKIQVGVNTDAGLVPDPDKIIQFFCEEFEELRQLVETIQANSDSE